MNILLTSVVKLRDVIFQQSLNHSPERGTIWSFFTNIGQDVRDYQFKSKIWIASGQHLTKSGINYSVKDWNTNLNKTIAYGTHLNLYAHFQGFLKLKLRYEKRTFFTRLYLRVHSYGLCLVDFKWPYSFKIRHDHCPGCHYFYNWPGSWYNLWLS